MEAQEFGSTRDFNDFENNNDSRNYILACKLNDYFLQAVVAIYNNDICSIYLEENINTKPIKEYRNSSIFKISKLKEHMESYRKNSFAPPTNVEIANYNDYIEIFNADINEDDKTIDIENSYMRSYICDLYDVKELYPFMVSYKGFIYGPFTMIKKDDENERINVDTFNSHKLHFGKYKVNNSIIVEFLPQNQKIIRKIVPSCQFDNLQKTYEKADFVSLDELKERVINDVTRHSNRYKLETLNEFKDLMTDFINSSNKILLPNDIERLKTINFTSNEFIIKLSTFLEPKFREVNNKINEKESELEFIEKDIKEKKNERLNLEQSFDKFKKDNDDKLHNAKIERENLLNEIEKLKNKKDNIRTEELERLEAEFTIKKKEVDSLNVDIKDNEIYKKRLESSIAALKKAFRKEQESANDVLSGLVVDKSYFDFLNGRDFTKRDNSQTNIQVYKSNFLNDYIELRTDIQEILRKNGRKFEDYFIDNLLISIHQNILTFFAGLPGTGKTSLARLICKSLTDEKRIREVSVGRGWTSQKDLIGFQNPLNDTFCAAPTNIYSLLKQLDYECQENFSDDYPMAYIILDEANLSPMEHYWSSFYALTDSYATKNSPLSINLGQGKSVKYNNTIRFIGTINFDQTTEELSHRVIDRANIIRLKPTKYDFNDSITKEDFESINISFVQIRKFFRLLDFEHQDVVFPTKFRQPYSEIKDIFYKELNVYISPRIDNAISRYCAIAKDLMIDDMRPLDFCIAQRLLPLINISYSENKLDNLLKKMKEIFVGMEDCKSIEILSEIVTKGNEYQAGYNYFMTLSNV